LISASAARNATGSVIRPEALSKKLCVVAFMVAPFSAWQS
jgi:hypothetical protein